MTPAGTLEPRTYDGPSRRKFLIYGVLSIVWGFFIAAVAYYRSSTLEASHLLISAGGVGAGAVLLAHYLQTTKRIHWTPQNTLVFEFPLRSIELQPSGIHSISRKRLYLTIIKHRNGRIMLDSQYDDLRDLVQRCLGSNPLIQGGWLTEIGLPESSQVTKHVGFSRSKGERPATKETNGETTPGEIDNRHAESGKSQRKLVRGLGMVALGYYGTSYSLPMIVASLTELDLSSIRSIGELLFLAIVLLLVPLGLFGAAQVISAVKEIAAQFKRAGELAAVEAEQEACEDP